MVLLSSCVRTTIVYHKDTSRYDGGEIRSGNLHLFFKEDNCIPIRKTELQGISNQLSKIKKDILLRGDTIAFVKIFENQEAVEADFYFYNYVFILNGKDTLYANVDAGVWRYGNRTLIRKSSIEHLLKEKGIPPQKTQH
jgi:hypothetical protein